MEQTGKIIAVLDQRSGFSEKTGKPWQLAGYVMETVGGQSRKMVFEVFGADRIAKMGIRLGETLTVEFDIDAREYQGKWYNSVKASGVKRDGGGKYSRTAAKKNDERQLRFDDGGDDDLPF